MILHIDDPGYCGNCPISAYGEYRCQAIDNRPEDENERWNDKERPSWCPLQPETKEEYEASAWHRYELPEEDGKYEVITVNYKDEVEIRASSFHRGFDEKENRPFWQWSAEGVGTFVWAWRELPECFKEAENDSKV